jgi:O-antigen/teichoic acid export membrane protein
MPDSEPLKLSDRAISLRGLLIRNFGMRLITLPISTGAGLLTIGITVRSLGPDGYASVAVVSTLLLLFIPMSDLGRGGAVVSAFSDATAVRDGQAEAVLAGALRFLGLVGVGTVALSILVSLVGGWPVLLGEGVGRVAALGTTMALVALVVGACVPLSLGGRVLLGVGRNEIATALAATAPVLALCWTALCAHFALGPRVFVFAVPISYLGQQVVQCAVALRIGRLSARRLALARSSAAAAARTRAVARPMVLIMIGLPLAMQSDRIVLSHVRPSSLAEYSLVAQMYAPLVSLLSTSGAALWPFFASRRSAGEGRQVWWKATLGLGGVGMALGCGLLAGGKTLGSLLGNGQVKTTWPVVFVFAGLLVVQGVQYATGVYLTRPAELRVQAATVCVMVPANLLGSIVLARHVGAAGPALSTLVCLLVFQWAALLPLIHSRRFSPVT